mgnify:CR=1 FL=1
MKDIYKPFNITSVCIADIMSIEKMDKSGKIKPLLSKSVINKITNSDMEVIARKLADDYCEQLFWSSLEIITEYVLNNKKKK